MEYLKLFEEFNIYITDDIIEETNKLLSNNKVMSTIDKLLKTVPLKYKKKMINYIIDNGINIDKIKYYIDKYDIVSRVNKMVNDGYDIQDITRKLVPVTESVSGIFAIIFIISLSVIFIGLIGVFIGHDEEYLVKTIVSAVIVTFLSGIMSVGSKVIEDNIRKNEIEQIDKRVTFQVDDKDAVIVIYTNDRKDSLEIYQNTDNSTYYVKKNDKVYKSYYHNKFE